jgi:hypothetical protein
MAVRKAVLIQLSIMTLGAALMKLEHSVVTIVGGAVLLGSVLVPLGTYYSLILEAVMDLRVGNDQAVGHECPQALSL